VVECADNFYIIMILKVMTADDRVYRNTKFLKFSKDKHMPYFLKIMSAR
jgi:hypothetical protein